MPDLSAFPMRTPRPVPIVIATTGWPVNTPNSVPQNIPHTAPVASAKGLMGARNVPCCDGPEGGNAHGDLSRR
jgi:hypothetical protein